MKDENGWKVTSCRAQRHLSDKEAKTMGPDDGNESRHSLPMGVGNDKRVDRNNNSDSHGFEHIDPQSRVLNYCFQ